MGWQSKATQAWCSNFGRPNNLQNPTVKDVSDDEDLESFEDNNLLEHGFFFLDDESLSEEDFDSNEDEELDEDELNELIIEAKIMHFNNILFEAQAMTVKAEHEAHSEKPKCKWHYTGNSTHTWQYHAQKCQKLAATGQKFINLWFTKEKKPASTVEVPPKDCAPETTGILDDSDASEGEGSEGDNEIGASLHCLFPGMASVSFWTYNPKKRTHQVEIGIWYNIHPTPWSKKSNVSCTKGSWEAPLTA